LDIWKRWCSHQVAAKLIKSKIWIWFLCNCKVYDSKPCKERQDLQVVEMTSGYPWTTKSSQSIREVCSGTYKHTYIYTSKAGTRGAPLVLSLWGPDIIFHVQDGLLITVFQASSIYLLSKVVCFVLFATLRSPKPWCIHALGFFRSLLMSKGALMWFETVWSYSVEAIDY
jgi:hypothetical protein